MPRACAEGLGAQVRLVTPEGPQEGCRGNGHGPLGSTPVGKWRLLLGCRPRRPRAGCGQRASLVWALEPIHPPEAHLGGWTSRAVFPRQATCACEIHRERWVTFSWGHTVPAVQVLAFNPCTKEGCLRPERKTSIATHPHLPTEVRAGQEEAASAGGAPSSRSPADPPPGPGAC